MINKKRIRRSFLLLASFSCMQNAMMPRLVMHPPIALTFANIKHMKSYHLQAERLHRLGKTALKCALLTQHETLGKHIKLGAKDSIVSNVIKNARHEMVGLFSRNFILVPDDHEELDDSWWGDRDMLLNAEIDALFEEHILLKIPRDMPKGNFEDRKQASYTAAHLLAILRNYDKVAAKAIRCYPYADAADALWHCTQWDILMPTSNGSCPSPEYKTVLRLFNGEPKI